jgi:hypothetical protein
VLFPLYAHFSRPFWTAQPLAYPAVQKSGAVAGHPRNITYFELPTEEELGRYYVDYAERLKERRRRCRELYNPTPAQRAEELARQLHADEEREVVEYNRQQEVKVWKFLSDQPRAIASPQGGSGGLRPPAWVKPRQINPFYFGVFDLRAPFQFFLPGGIIDWGLSYVLSPSDERGLI